jgi:outer membrane protein, adhesin transport system
MSVKFVVPAALALGVSMPGQAAPAPPAASLPPASSTPLAAESGDDPILALGRASALPDGFRRIVADAVARHPALAEARAGEDEARAARGEARAGQLPSGTVTISNYQVLSRAFSNDPFNIIERSRARYRTDAVLSLQQPLFDFGATQNRIAAANSRMKAAEAQTEETADQVALRAIASWYDVFGFRALVSLGRTFAENQRQIREDVQTRITRGVAAEGDIAQVDSYIGNADRRLAAFTRQLANAEARYGELIGQEPPAAMMRAPFVAVPLASKDFAVAGAARIPAVEAAEAAARAARNDAQSVRASNLPQVSVGVDAGRYGVFENRQDYDVRGSVLIRQRLFGGTVSRENQAEARARSATARANRVREEAMRDAAIAWSDVQALETELSALESSYVASRRSRDVLVERFRASRGTLFDVLSAEDNLFQAATAYVQTLTERDTARYVLLSRSGRLLEALEIQTTPETRRP